MLNLLFFKKVLNKSYSSLWGIGLVGSSLAGRMAALKSIDYYYMSDEFPDIHHLKIWVNSEKQFARIAKKWIVPDESRVDITIQQIPGLNAEKSVVIPNAPLIEDRKTAYKIDWHSRFGIPQGSEIVLYAGGIDRENNIELLLSVFPFSGAEFYLVIIGGDRGYATNSMYSHPRIKWMNDRLNDEDLFSLHQSSLCIIAFYSSMFWLEYVGKSSGKIMRALIAGCPVIATNFKSCNFIKEKNFGVLIDQPHQLIMALVEIKRNKHFYKEQIVLNRDSVSFEHYWKASKLLQ
jgi:glycosyltransferase involved in cell wall biosynthesis